MSEPHESAMRSLLRMIPPSRGRGKTLDLDYRICPQGWLPDWGAAGWLRSDPGCSRLRRVQGDDGLPRYVVSIRLDHPEIEAMWAETHRPDEPAPRGMPVPPAAILLSPADHLAQLLRWVVDHPERFAERPRVGILTETELAIGRGAVAEVGVDHAIRGWVQAGWALPSERRSFDRMQQRVIVIRLDHPEVAPLWARCHEVSS